MPSENRIIYSTERKLLAYSSSSAIRPHFLPVLSRRMIVVLGGSLYTIGTGSSSPYKVVISTGFEARTASFWFDTPREEGWTSGTKLSARKGNSSTKY